MFRCKFVFVFALLVCSAGAAFAQSSADADSVNAPLIVGKGAPLQVLVTEKLRLKQNAPVHGKVIEPVFAFDREVIPAGTQVEGTITGFQKGSTWKRVSAMLGGDFTPVREPRIEFHTLIFSDGERLPIQTSVVDGSEKVVGADGQHGSEAKNSLMSTVKPGKEQLKNWAWGLAPYHPQYLAVGVRLNATLLAPLDFGEATFKREELDEIGSEPPADSVASIRLVTPLKSDTVQPGSSVEAILTRPIFSADHKLLFPVGSTVHGNVTEAKSAAAFHRHGRLAFTLTTLAPPAEWMSGALDSQKIDTSLVSIQVHHDMKDLRINDGNSTRIVESKKRFIAPAWSFFKAGRSFSSTEDSFSAALLGAYRGKFLKRVTGGGETGFGLPASISGAMFPPVGIGFGFYGAARSAYSNFLGRGRDINLPENTSMEIRIEKRSRDNP